MAGMGRTWKTEVGGRRTFHELAMRPLGYMERSMAEPWFRWRTPDQGQGYSVASREGWIVTATFVVVATVAAVGPPLIGRGSAASLILAAFLFCASVAALLVVIRQHSDWHG